MINTLLVVLHFIFYFNQYQRLLFSKLNDYSIIFESLSKNYLLNIIHTNFDLMYNLWKTMVIKNLSKNEIRYIFSQLYPSERMN